MIVGCLLFKQHFSFLKVSLNGFIDTRFHHKLHVKVHQKTYIFYFVLVYRQEHLQLSLKTQPLFESCFGNYYLV